MHASMHMQARARVCVCEYENRKYLYTLMHTQYETPIHTVIEHLIHYIINLHLDTVRSSVHVYMNKML